MQSKATKLFFFAVVALAASINLQLAQAPVITP
jgi:hypothetical protein